MPSPRPDRKPAAPAVKPPKPPPELRCTNPLCRAAIVADQPYAIELAQVQADGARWTWDACSIECLTAWMRLSDAKRQANRELTYGLDEVLGHVDLESGPRNRATGLEP